MQVIDYRLIDEKDGFIMEKKAFYVIEQICNGCENCSLVCSMILNKTGFGKKSNITIIRADEAGYNQPGMAGTGFDEPVVGCNADPCDGDPKCVRYCPTGALIYGTLDEIEEKKLKLMELWKTNNESKVRAPWAQRRE
jgi:Fe-S-cluster-containing dehydrogenase component